MLDRFKFRVWDLDEGVFVDPDLIRVDSALGDIHFGCSDRGRYEVQQWTGKTDRTAREIYEGDILYYESKAVEWSGRAGKFKGPVEWVEKDSCFVYKYGKGDDDVWDLNRHFEYHKSKVVGNILRDGKIQF